MLATKCATCKYFKDCKYKKYEELIKSLNEYINANLEGYLRDSGGIYFPFANEFRCKDYEKSSFCTTCIKQDVCMFYRQLKLDESYTTDCLNYIKK